MDHIAFIMDGNGRWAENHSKTRQHGHEIGSSNVYNIFLSCIDLGIHTATFFAMSSENMSRSKEETEYISTLLDNSIKQHLDDLLANNVKFRVIGDLSHLPESIRETDHNCRMPTLNLFEFEKKMQFLRVFGFCVSNCSSANRVRESDVSSFGWFA